LKNLDSQQAKNVIFSSLQQSLRIPVDREHRIRLIVNTQSS